MNASGKTNPCLRLYSKVVQRLLPIKANLDSTVARTMADEDLVKLEPAASPAGFTDEDIYEDAGDLEFNGDPNYHMLYLARVPKYIWDTWSKLDDDAEIQIGTIRKSTERGADGVEKVTPLPFCDFH